MSKSDMKRRNILAGKDMMDGVYEAKLIGLHPNERIIDIETLDEMMAHLEKCEDIAEYDSVVRLLEKLKALRGE